MSKHNTGRNDNKNNGTRNEHKQTHQPGAPNKSNRQSKGHEKDDSSGAEKNTTKKHGNSI